ncbi:MAG TPA: transcription-repair coupling factor [Candidatus Aphodousia gallistercoris]|nr:transcription-repair coupling factor [Candidatus Aphodousia gallistercoris]
MFEKLQDQINRDLKALSTKAKRSVNTGAAATDALWLSMAAAQIKATGKSLVIISDTASEALRLVDEIRYFATELRVDYFPDWETLPYDMVSPHQDLVSERLEVLYRLVSGSQDRPDVLISTPTTVAQTIAPPEYLAGRVFFFKKGEEILPELLRERLIKAGYSHVSQVVAPGEFSVRGSLIDIFPMGTAEPFRLDLFDNEIDSIRSFDPDTQRSIASVDEIRILPGREYPVDSDSLVNFRANWRKTFTGDPSKYTLYKDLSNGIIGAGIEYYLPLFFERRATLFDYLQPECTVIALTGDNESTLNRFIEETEGRYRFLSADTERPVLPVRSLYLNSEGFFTALKPYARFQLKTDLSVEFTPDARIERKLDEPTLKLEHFLQEEKLRKHRVLIMAASSGRRETMSQLFARGGMQIPYAEDFAGFLAAEAWVMLGVGPLYRGFSLEGITVLTETELYAAAPKRSRRSHAHASNVDTMIRDLAELRIGDPVVHLSHGIGRYAGLQTIETSCGKEEFLRLDYANDAKLFVPVAQLQLISRYTGSDAEHAPLHHLGKNDWDKAKKKAAEKVRDTAAELLNLYALREKSHGHAFEFSRVDYENFAESFPFEETPDQAAAIEAVLDDMKKDRPMDRLVCGDVGFGKTEVALRAAFAAVMGGKQVAVLCPTTLLAEQHAHTFKDRFASWPVTVAELSRFRTARQTTEVLSGLEKGSIDIVVGTHKLLSDKVKFARLGLVVIDEEHRFGVRQKEMLKKLRADVDVLTLTATPIPRTLAMSLEGIRDFSVIATAPERRLSIKTIVQRETPDVIREAIMRELKRGGQVYFLHNDVATIENRREQLTQLVPEARIVIGHGQMSERELEVVMRDFYHQRFNVLLCTTIIETGIDVPTANTIIMHRADKFGLAQLHQLRGRVGRSHHQAYAYLLTPGKDALTKNAEKRLEAIQNSESLGSGFYLSMHDLEIRGAGEVLGEHQSGEIAAVGYDLYNQMLKRAVKSMRNNESFDLDAPFQAMAEINLHAPALLPSDYVDDVHQRLSFYKELASCESFNAIETVREALGDRYGKLPPEANTLIDTHRLRLYCQKLGIARIEATDSVIFVTFIDKPHFEPLRLIELMQKSKNMRMMTSTKLKIEISTPDVQSRTAFLRGFMRALDGSKD